MLFRKVTTAFIVVACSTFTVQAQGVRDIPAPRENPPAGFAGQQYVDSSGCVFMRAGFDGQTRWVPRVGSDREVLCGYPPTFAQAQEAPAPRVAPQPVGPEPVETVAVPATAPPQSASTPPEATAVPARTTTVSAPRTAAPQPGQTTPVVRTATRPTGCPAAAPVAERVPLRGGGTAILCVTKAGALSNRALAVSAEAMAPQRPMTQAQKAHTQLVCPGWAPQPRRFLLADGGTTTLCTQGNGSLEDMTAPIRRQVQGTAVAALPPIQNVEPIVPPGYRLAWKDDRLNPHRAEGTVAGQMAQDRIWTRDVPATLVADLPQTRRAAREQVAVVSTRSQEPPSPARQGALRLSTRSDAAAPVAAKPAGRAYVQVGTFGQPSNADGARSRLAALGLPVSTGKLTSGGTALQVVFAGPFADAGQAQSALTAARRAGFADAFIR